MKKIMFIVVAVLVLALASASPAAALFDNFDTPHNYLTDGLGAYDGLLDSGGVTINAMETSTNRPGELYIQTDGSLWKNATTGDLLYKEWTGDFVVTVKVTDFAGSFGDIVRHNAAGIMARDPAAGPENWVSVVYFPTWTGFQARSNDDDVLSSSGGVAKGWDGVDTFAIAEAYPWIQLERVGDNFYPRVSADGVTFFPLTDPEFDGIPDGTQTPLVFNRPDLPETLQLGLYQDDTSGVGDQVGGYAAFDNFSIVGGFDFEPTPANGATVAVADPLTLSWLNLPDPCTVDPLVDVYWDTDSLGDGGTQVLTDSDLMTVDVTADVIKTYYWKIVATDEYPGGTPFVAAETLYSVIAIDGCEFAKTEIDPPYTEEDARLKGDTNYDCKVNLLDFAAIAENWLDDVSF